MVWLVSTDCATLRPMSFWSLRTGRWPSWWTWRRTTSVVCSWAPLRASRRAWSWSVRSASLLSASTTICSVASSIRWDRLSTAREISIWATLSRCRSTVRLLVWSIVSPWRNRCRQVWRPSTRWFLSDADSVSLSLVTVRRVRPPSLWIPSSIRRVSTRQVSLSIVSM